MSALSTHGKTGHRIVVIGNMAECREFGCDWMHVIDGPQRRKNNDRDGCLMELFPARSRRLRGWISWPHTSDEIEGIRLFLETGDDRQLPRADDGRELYPA